MLDFIRKWLTGSNEAEVKKISKIVDQINALEPEMQRISDEQLSAKTEDFKKRLAQGESLDDLLVEAFAVVREAAVRVLGMRPFDTQLMGGIILHQGRIAEMKTGEGKTLVAPLASYLNALNGKGVHIVTVNDYLAKYHSEWMGKLHRFLGISVGLVLHDMSNEERQNAYNCDITYATNNELGFDYLRDNMVIHKEECVQRELAFAIIDEVDSILIDEARTPLIISGQGDKSTEMYTLADRFVVGLKPEEDYTTDEKQKSVILTEQGVQKAERHFQVENLTDLDNTELNHHIHQALRARALMKRDVDYVVQEDQIIIVDEFTGRLMIGRRYSEGLHQAIEAKEGVKVENESKTLATVTFQNYFRMYKKLSGMTGTAKTEEDEFKSIYGLDVVQIPTNKPMIRKDMTDVVYSTEKGKFKAVVEEIIEKNKNGQPVLVGTVSVEISEMLSDMLARRGVRHVVLNAKHHKREAEIVAQAGHEGAVTIATNMAGRGTDILLGGNPEFLAKQEMRQRGMEEELIEAGTSHQEDVPEEIKEAQRIYRELYQKHKKETDRQHDHVVKLGGLHIIGTERHESRRIDNQLRGRAGRQGDPGSSRFFISLEDELMRLFGSDRIRPLVERLGLTEDEPIEYNMLSKQIENAQKRVESRNFDIRKHVLQYDDVMNTQREVMYSQRRQVLEGDDMRSAVIDMIHAFNERMVETYCGNIENSEEWDLAGMFEFLNTIYWPDKEVPYSQDEITLLTKDKVGAKLNETAEQLYVGREAEAAESNFDMRAIEREIVLRVVDQYWMEHIDNMDRLRQGIGLRAIGHRDPVVEYKFEGYDMFDSMISSIQEDVVRLIFRIPLKRPVVRRVVMSPVEITENLGDQPAAKPRPQNKSVKRVGRNEPCPCGSGKKYKHCHGANV